MARSRRKTGDVTVSDAVLDAPDATLLDIVDKLLNKGVMATGDVTLGVAGVDLVYLRLSALLCAADRVSRPDASRIRRRRGPRARRGRA
jgi:hypothetical protein